MPGYKSYTECFPNKPIRTSGSAGAGGAQVSGTSYNYLSQAADFLGGSSGSQQGATGGGGGVAVDPSTSRNSNSYDWNNRDDYLTDNSDKSVVNPYDTWGAASKDYESSRSASSSDWNSRYLFIFGHHCPRSTLYS